MRRRTPMLVIGLLAISVVSQAAAQEGESPIDSVAAPASTPARRPAKRARPPAFYQAPDISAVWEGARRRVTSRHSAGL
ncbi:MAG: hypothetical protein V3W14_02315, partial [Candidatus Neomarinimicrobiota bacterium]